MTWPCHLLRPCIKRRLPEGQQQRHRCHHGHSERQRVETRESESERPAPLVSSTVALLSSPAVSNLVFGV